MYLKHRTLIIFLVLLCNFGRAQNIKPDEKSSYFIYLSNVSTREDVLSLEQLIKTKNGVEYFMAERFPVRYFMLKVNHSITQQEFESWIVKKKYKVMSFGFGVAGKENACIVFKSQTQKTKVKH